MESEARYVWVGAMLIALFLAMSAAIYWISGAGETLPTKRYTVYFQKQSLEGLQIGSEVRMRGIKVGQVADYGILSDNSRGVRVLLEVDERIPLLEGALATVNRKLVTGIAGVDLGNTRSSGPPLSFRPAGEPYPVISEGVPEMTRMAGVLEDLGASGGEALTRLNRLLSDGNQRAIAATLANTRELTAQLAQTAPALNATLEHSQRAASHLEELGIAATATLQGVDRNIDSLARETRSTLGAARETLGTANAALGQVRNEIAGLGVNLRLAVDLTSQDLQSTSRVLRESGRALQQSARAFGEPERILFGPAPGNLGPGEVEK